MFCLDACSAEKASQSSEEKRCSVSRPKDEKPRQFSFPLWLRLLVEKKNCHGFAALRSPSLLPLVCLQGLPTRLCCVASMRHPPYWRHLRSCPYFVVVRRHSRPTLMPPDGRHAIASLLCFADFNGRYGGQGSPSRPAPLIAGLTRSRPSRPGSYGAVGGGRSGSFSRRLPWLEPAESSSFTHLPCHSERS